MPKRLIRLITRSTIISHRPIIAARTITAPDDADLAEIAQRELSAVAAVTGAIYLETEVSHV